MVICEIVKQGNATIDTVYVYDKKRIEVVFSFDDVLMKAIEKYQKGVKEA